MGALAFPISGLFFVPIFYRLGATSVYEYFEHRFHSKLLRRLTAFIFMINTIVYMGVVVYAPAVALDGVTGYGTWPMILVIDTIIK
jgi:sodium-coupled monocarboxylate transporter 8/12